MRTYEECVSSYRELGLLMAELKTSDMQIVEFKKRVSMIFKDRGKERKSYSNLLRFYSGLKELSYDKQFIRDSIRHEWLHAQIAREIVKEFDHVFVLHVQYTLERVSVVGPFGAAIRIAPGIDFPNVYDLIGTSKEKLLYFFREMLVRHNDLSKTDRELAERL